MVGRETAIEDLERRIVTERLVTIVGPSGIGKTTLALALAHRRSARFGDDVAFVDLAVRYRGWSVAGAVATALGSVEPQFEKTAGLIPLLRRRRLLLCLDRCEHAIDGTRSLVAAIVRDAPRTNILATSCHPLNAPCEYLHHLASLETPPPASETSFDEVSRYPAADLFIERVIESGGHIGRSADDARIIAEICRKLNGVPLAIELAARRVDAFGLAMTLALLDGRYRAD